MKNKVILAIGVFTMLLIYSCSQGSAVDLGNGYRFDYDPVISRDDAIFGPDENVYAVEGHVTGYNFDSTFIVAEQKPRHVILRDTYRKLNITLPEEDKIFEQSTFRQFWIINKKQDKRYGPFTKEKFLEKRGELGIDLKL